MTTWHTVESAKSEWAGAPDDDTLRELLDVARAEVIAYAPALTGQDFEPATVTWPTGETVTLTREGDIVTATIDPGTDNVLPGEPMPWPAEHFTPDWPASVFVKPHENYVLLVSVGDMTFLGNDGGPYLPGTARWIADPAEGDGIPEGYRWAHLAHARNIWNASMASPSGSYSDDGTFQIRPFPLDWSIKQRLRPATLFGGPVG